MNSLSNCWATRIFDQLYPPMTDIRPSHSARPLSILPNREECRLQYIQIISTPSSGRSRIHPPKTNPFFRLKWEKITWHEELLERVMRSRVDVKVDVSKGLIK